MWSLLNSTRFPAERFFKRERDGSETWVVIVKQTFDIGADGVTVWAEQQEPIHLTPQFFGDPLRTSLRRDTDLLSPHACTDVVVVGSAHAPAGRTCVELEVSMQIASISKRLRVWGDRRWLRGITGRLAPSRPEPFERMPLVYERAFGGFDPEGTMNAFEPRNPAGVGFSASPASLEGELVANIEQPDRPIRGAGDRPPPAGFGPIAAHWAPRSLRAGTYDRRWEEERMPLVPLDFDERHDRCAPDDQQLAFPLVGGESVELRNMTADGLLRFTIPREPLIFSTRIAGEVRRHDATIQTVILEPDRRRVVIVWATAVPCHQSLYSLEGTWVRYLPRSQPRSEKERLYAISRRPR